MNTYINFQAYVSKMPFLWKSMGIPPQSPWLLNMSTWHPKYFLKSFGGGYRTRYTHFYVLYRNSLWHMYHYQKQPKHNCGTVVYRLLLLYNFIYQNLDSGSAQVQILLEACQRFAMVRIFDNGLTGNKEKYLSLANHTTKTINHHRQSLNK